MSQPHDMSAAARPEHRRPDLDPERALDLLAMAATLLFTNGQTTERTTEYVENLAKALGFSVRVFLRWDEVTVAVENGGAAASKTVEARPVGIEMGKVAATTKLIDDFCNHASAPELLWSALAEVEARPPVSLIRFASFAAIGAAALGVIFGAAHLTTLLIIAVSAGLGACVRRWIAGVSHNPFAQPLAAALLAGAIGALVVDLQFSTLQRLVAVCPCMVLVPGPHVLNGTIDLARGRLALGICRVVYASLIIFAICIGLLVGLSFGGINLPASAPSPAVPLVYDVIAAGVAVAAYGTFFSMPWRMLPVPILIGMLAHGVRWALLAKAGASLAGGAFIACLIVGVITTPVAERLRLPYAGLAFASVVSLIPGVLLFRMADGLVELVADSGSVSSNLLRETLADGANAFLITVAITLGLILPKMLIGDLLNKRFTGNAGSA
jgi:uncharacterized membrane protein YjjP (DUF1212 family)